jgi:hypothetical protein
MNFGICAAFLSIHYCPFQHPLGMYQQDPHNTVCATTSHDKLAQKQDQIETLFVADLPWGEHFHVSLVAEEVPLSMRPK